MKKILMYLILLFIIINNVLFTQVQDDKKHVSKIGSNLFGFILVEDYNVLYERQIKKNYSLLSTVHYIKDDYFYDYKTKFKFSLGGRAYSSETPFRKKPSPFDLIGNFVQLKSSMVLIDEEFFPTIEFGIGQSSLFNDNVYSEYFIGMGRFLTYEEDNMNYDRIPKVFFILSYVIGFVY